MAETTLAYSPTVQSAIDDPEGARRFLQVYGELSGWPAGGLKPIPCGSGELAWVNAIIKFPPEWLGQAVEQIEKAEREPKRYRKATEPMETKGTDDMVILAPAKSVGLEAGIYRAQITDISETKGTFNGKETLQFQIQFVILDASGQKTDQEMRGWCSQVWHERSKLYKWSRGVLGVKRCPSADDEFDTDLLLNKKCDIEVIDYKRNDGNMGTKIENLYKYQSVSVEEDDGDNSQDS